jgi:hypothetical protein
VALVRKPLRHLLSLLAASLVVIGLAWVSAKMINTESSLPQEESEGTVYLRKDLRRQCDEHMLDFLQLVSDSQSCKKDNDCDLVDYRYGYQGMGGCSFPVHKDKADLVSSELNKSSRCLEVYCRDRGYVRRGNSGMVTCQDNICVHESVPGISPDHLQEQTLKTISEDLAEEG